MACQWLVVRRPLQSLILPEKLFENSFVPRKRQQEGSEDVKRLEQLALIHSALKMRHRMSCPKRSAYHLFILTRGCAYGLPLATFLMRLQRKDRVFKQLLSFEIQLE